MKKILFLLLFVPLFIEAQTPGQRFYANKPTIAATDPYWSNVVLLMKAVGTSGSSFVDSKNAYTLTNTNVSVSSDTPFASSTGSMDGTSTGFLTVSTSGVNFNPGTSNFTIEAWVKLPLNHPDGMVIVFTRAWSAYNYLVFAILNDGTANFIVGHQISGFVGISGVGSIPSNTWRHIAMVREGNVISGYINGSRVGQGTLTSSATNLNSTLSTQNPGIGGYTHDAFGRNNGKLYDVRYTVGVARYSGTTYTVPTTPFPTQ